MDQEEEDTIIEVSKEEPEDSDPDTFVLEPGDGEEDTPWEYDEDSDNLVADFMEHPGGLKALREISEKVSNDAKDAWDSCEGWRQRMADDWKLMTGELPPKTFPWENCANVHVPIMLQNMLRLTTRVSSEIFGNYTDVFAYVPTGPDDEEEAEALTIHSNWQLREGIPDFQRQQDRGIMAFFVWGDVSAHSYYDPERRMNRHEILTPDDLAVPYSHISTMPDYSDVPYLVKILRLQRHQLQAKRGDWLNVDRVINRDPPEWDSDDLEDTFRSSVAESTAIVKPTSSENAPYKLLHYEGWLELPGQDRDRYCQVILDDETKNILKLTIHEEVHWRDKLKEQYQYAELVEWRQAMEQYQEQVAQQDIQDEQVRQQIIEQNLGPEEVERVLSQMQSIPGPERPSPPSWVEDPDAEEIAPPAPRKQPIHMFSHGVCIENMAGTLGLSFGQIQADFTRGANTAMNQFTDAATLNNAWTIITSGEVQFKDGFKVAPGRVNHAENIDGEDLKKNIMELKPQPASEQLLQVTDRLYSWGESSVQANAVLSGEPGKSGEAARGLLARIEQATKQLSVPASRYATIFLRQILLNNAYLNSVFLPEDEMQQLLDWKVGMMRNVRIGRHMYARGYNVQIRADMRFTTEAQRVADADAVAQMVNAFPILQQNIGFIHRALRKSLEARRQHEMVPYLGPDPGPPQTPLGMPPPQPPGPPGAPPQGGPPQGGGPPPGPQG